MISEARPIITVITFDAPFRTARCGDASPAACPACAQGHVRCAAFRASDILKSSRNPALREKLRFAEGEVLMVAGQASTDDVFETLLRRAITDSVIGGRRHGGSGGEDLIARLRHYARRAHQEHLSSQTLQVISSARRLLGDEPEAGLDP
jgi:hypothetical protein